MKQQIRCGVFETNGSSTHSLVMCVASKFDKWVKGEVYYCDSACSDERDAGFKSGEFYPIKKVDSYYAEKGEERDTYSFITYDEFANGDLESSEYSYTTPSGEVIKAVAKYGYDG